MENELIKHIIEVDEFIRIELNIPKVITPLELKALMFRTNQIFKLSDVPIKPTKVTKTGKKKVGRVNSVWTEEMISSMVDMHANTNLSGKQIAEKLNNKFDTSYFTPRKVYDKVAYVKRKGTYDDYLEKGDKIIKKSDDSEKKEHDDDNGLFRYTEEMETDIIKLTQKGFMPNEIKHYLNRKHDLNLDNKQISNKIYSLKTTGKIEED